MYANYRGYEKFSIHRSGLNILAVYGGANIVPQIKALKLGAQIVVATPGRLVDLIDRKVAKLENVRFVVLDEADEMLNMGFKDEIDKILIKLRMNDIPGFFLPQWQKELSVLLTII